MMASLPQTPAQTGLASILAALGQAAPAGTATDAPGFEQLFATLPTTAPATIGATATAPAAASLFGVQTSAQPGAETATTVGSPELAGLPAPATTPAPPAAALFGLPQPAAEGPVDAVLPHDTPAKAPAAPATNAQPAKDAAAAASLLIAVATPLKGVAPASDKPAPANSGEGDTSVDSDTVPMSAVPIAQAVTAIVEAPVAATVIAAAMPTPDKPLADKASKPVAPTAAHRQADAAQPAPAAAKPAEAVSPQPVAFAAVEPKAAKAAPDAGASMAVLFAQTDLQGSAPLLEAAKAAPLAERTLDLSSDDQWIAQLAADIAATKSGKGDISFRLMPRHLGRLDVSMLSGDEGVTLKLDTQHEATATIVQAAQPRLVEDLRQQGVRVADAQVTHTPAETGRQQQSQNQQRGNAPDASHLIETAGDQADPTHDERAADRRGRFA